MRSVKRTCWMTGVVAAYLLVVTPGSAPARQAPGAAPDPPPATMPPAATPVTPPGAPPAVPPATAASAPASEPPAVPAVVEAVPLAIRDVDMEAESLRTKGDATPRGRPVDVVAGLPLKILINQDTVDSVTYRARFKAELDPAVADVVTPAWRHSAATDALTIVAPALSDTAWSARRLFVEEVSGDTVRTSAAGFPINVAPPPSAVIHDISPRQLPFETSVKVTGTGFFAPRDQIVLRVGEITAKTLYVSPHGDSFTAEIPHDLSAKRLSKSNLFDSLWGDQYDAGQRNISVEVWKVPAAVRTPEDAAAPGEPLTVTLHRPTDGRYTIELFAGFVGAVIVGVVLGFLYLLYRSARRGSGIAALAHALLLDPQTQTYSLSRAQFFWWLLVIVYGYLFVFLAHGIHQGRWTFPPLQGFAFTFLISLGTLLVAQTTTAIKGAKGAGVVHPSPSDLIVHGGVFAPERVQQVVWTVLTGLGFLWIVFKTHSTTDGLPEIPSELLVLMGLSSAGYLGGKLARKAGPIIKRVEVSSGSVILKIFGEHLSDSARILIDSVELTRDKIEVHEPDQDHPNEFVKALKITVPDSLAQTEEAWFSRSHLLVLINADTQRAEWTLQVPKITAIEVGQPDTSGRRTISVLGEQIEPGAVLVMPETAEEIPLTPVSGTPSTRWTATVTNWPDAPAQVTIKAPTGARVSLDVKPSQGATVPPKPDAPPVDAAVPAEPDTPPRDAPAAGDADIAPPDAGTPAPDEPAPGGTDESLPTRPTNATGPGSVDSATTLETHRDQGNEAAEKTGTATNDDDGLPSQSTDK